MHYWPFATAESFPGIFLGTSGLYLHFNSRKSSLVTAPKKYSLVRYYFLTLLKALRV